MTNIVCRVVAALFVSTVSLAASAVTLLTAGTAPVPLMDNFEIPHIVPPAYMLDIPGVLPLTAGAVSALFAGTTQTVVPITSPNAVPTASYTGTPTSGLALIALGKDNNLAIFDYSQVPPAGTYGQTLAGLLTALDKNGDLQTGGSGTMAIRFDHPQTVIGFDIIDWQSTGNFIVTLFDETGATVGGFSDNLPGYPTYLIPDPPGPPNPSPAPFLTTWTLTNTLPFSGLIFESRDNYGFALDSLRYSPLPGTLPLLLLGALGLGAVRRLRLSHGMPLGCRTDVAEMGLSPDATCQDGGRMSIRSSRPRV